MTRLLLLLACLLLVTACASSKDSRPPVEQQAERLLERGVFAYQQGDALTASHHFTRALVRYQGFDQREGQLEAHLNLATSLLQLGRLEAAEDQARTAEHLALALKKPKHQQQALWLRARRAWLAEEVDLSLRHLEKLLNNQEQRPEAAVELSALALGARITLHLTEDRTWLYRFQQQLADQPSPAHQLQLRRLLAWQTWLEGDFPTAVLELEAVLAIYRQQAWRPGLAATLDELGQLHQQQGALDQAEDYFQRALRIRLQLQDRHQARKLLLNLASLYAAQGRKDQEMAALEQAARL